MSVQAPDQKPTQPRAIPQGLTRVTVEGGKYVIPLGIVPKGWSYEWKRYTNLGLEDKSHQLSLARNHWQPVPAARHPELFGKDPGPAIRDGLMLMERPAYLTEEAKSEDLRNAVGQINQQMVRLDQIPGIGKDFEQTRPSVQRSYERNEVPDDEDAKHGL